MSLKRILIIAFLIIPVATFAQDGKTINDFVSGMKKFEGFLDFYYDEEQGKVFLEIDQLNEEILYINSLPAGVGSNDIGLDRGQLGGSRIVRFEKFGPKIMMIQPNYSYRAISDNQDEVKAVKEAFAESILAGFTIMAKGDGSFLVDITDFLIRDAHNVSGRLKNTGQGNYSLDKNRSAVYIGSSRNFPQNTELEAILTFKGTPQGRYIRSVAPNSQSVTVRQHHSFVQLPDDNYTPREFDPRAGYFGISYMDYATPIDQQIRKRYIARHRLEKKNPGPAPSEPVEPIIYYVDRGAPEPVKSALIEGASWWNQAFEAAGFVNAFQVREMPEGADPMDVRYNTIQWVHRSTRGWSYGSSVRDPRTGEIIKGHVTLGSLRVRQDFLIAQGLTGPYDGDDNTKPLLEMALARIRQLSAHEVGHTLGLAHNFSASTMDRASVMDYPHPLVKLDANGAIDLSDAYDDKIGEWDKVSIRYGYSQFNEGSTETDELNKILTGALDNGLYFISDQDARPAGGAHITAHLWDNGSDAAIELNRVMGVRAQALSSFSEKNIPEGDPMTTLEEVLVPVYLFHRYQTEAAVKLIGGLDYRYAHRGDGQQPVSVISAPVQNNAIRSVLQTINTRNLILPDNILSIIPPRAMGYGRSRETFRSRAGVAFDPLAAAETAADFSLGLLLHPQRGTRLVEQHAMNASYPGLESLLEQLVGATWKTPIPGGYAGEVQRAVNNLTLQHLMKLASQNESAKQVNAITWKQIDDLKEWLKSQTRKVSDPGIESHYEYAVSLIDRFQKNPEIIEEFETLRIPDGSPIGSDLGCGSY